MTSAEQSIVNQVVAAVEHAGPRLSGFSVTFKFANGRDGMTVWGNKESPDAVQKPEAESVPLQPEPSGSEEVPSGDPAGSEAAEASEEKADPKVKKSSFWKK
jgi:hypothetical protein